MITAIKYIVFKSIDCFWQICAPSYCVYCQIFTKERTFLCHECIDLIIPIATKQFFITEKYQATVFAVSDYQDPLRLLTLGKYYKNRVASVQLAELVWECTDLKYQDFDIIVPIPLHWSRYAWRWFNQSQIMAEVISKKSGKPVASLLKRQRRTIFQTGLSYAQRAQNLKEAFVLQKNVQQYKESKILIVDDVLTTGATLYEAGHTVTKINPEKIIFAVACRVGNR
jgi:ComF family protein